MNRNILTLIILTLCFAQVKAQRKINIPLKHELDSLYILDQKYRAMMSVKLDSAKIDSIKKSLNLNEGDFFSQINKIANKTDSSNVKRVEEIIAQYGYPGSSLVDTPTNQAAFFVLQHSTVIDKYLPVIEKAAKDKELPFRLYAMMKDRSLMYNKKEQIWGTQLKGMTVINPETKKPQFKFFVWPISDPKNVNKRRKQAGFEQTAEENAKRLGVDYKVYTLQQALKGQVD
ncbi:hypothetical protein D0C36_02475 [Mucilaginibacter conchicola]|uniref:Uncharacterized protein n=1 Tax=Mucilaginibacter conchicola TaxID=2303333 RepID=A0A372NWE2_9SPHI|nr:DUF6624 domain-containing protein [Mucilaginibacter conchicola]RFZ94436.1 hypothetical protein D0C36_02475 [Mucilaginibacter conchicola]